LSGAMWDEDHHMIVLDDEHLLGHTRLGTAWITPQLSLFFCFLMSNSYICLTK
jgi:hypothetical protein